MPETNSFKHYMKSDGLLDNSIYTILEDSKQNLWIAYKFGISRFNSTRDGITNYLLNTSIRFDGLITRAATIDDNDILYFGSANGYYTFNPNDLKNSNSHKPQLQLTHVNVNNIALPFEELLSKHKRFDLYHNDKLMTLDFAALEFKTPEQVQYHFRMIGIQNSWQDVSTTRHIELNNLIPGNYRLEIRATNNDGRWTNQNLNIELNVHPVWWNLGWVRVVFAIIGLFLVFSIHNYRTYKIRKQNLLLEAQVKRRTSELLLLNEQLKSASQTDYLTGLYNRMGFFNKFKDKQSDTNQSCIVISDIDNFKTINDDYSHSAGDEVLKEVARIMRSNIDKEDLLARWGGEEFIFYFNAKDASQTYQVIELIRKEIQNTLIVYKDQKISISCTFGISQRQNEISLSDCINAADEAMYIGKSKGRNTTIISK